ncbi:MAG: N-6 DNA methylase [Ilumatobacter sp.]|uniref:N-6 DNA methylase n=1 Tax=Ilumatobacter sp. TaxID=1967498 RepID=UPI003C7415E0
MIGDRATDDVAASNASADRKQRGAWFTPQHLVDAVVEAVVDDAFVACRRDRPIQVLDPACGDGRFLTTVRAAVERRGGSVRLVGVDVDASTIAAIDSTLGIDTVCADALGGGWIDSVRPDGGFDLVIGNPPYLSQMAAATSRGGSSGRGGGPYMDAAAEFLALGSELVDANGGRLAYVVPQSILSARDAGDVRRRIDDRSTMFWSAWTGERDFDAQVVTCAVAFEFAPSASGRSDGNWSHVVTERSGVPALASVFERSEPSSGRLGDRVRLNANFRDEYYGMIPAVGDHAAGPPLITSGLIDPGRSLWGVRPVRFAKQRFSAPRIDVAALDAKMTRWAEQRLVPKVLIANQTPILEAVCDPDGDWLPGVPVVSAYPLDPEHAVGVAWSVAAMLTSPAASVWAWHQRGGTGLGPSAIRVGPTMLAELAWPDGSLADAIGALRAGEIMRCGELVDAAYGVTSDEHESSMTWWSAILDRIERRS